MTWADRQILIAHAKAVRVLASQSGVKDWIRLITYAEQIEREILMVQVEIMLVVSKAVEQGLRIDQSSTYRYN